jgi:hypothetical protein
MSDTTGYLPDVGVLAVTFLKVMSGRMSRLLPIMSNAAVRKIDFWFFFFTW